MLSEEYKNKLLDRLREDVEKFEPNEKIYLWIKKAIFSFFMVIVLWFLGTYIGEIISLIIFGVYMFVVLKLDANKEPSDDEPSKWIAIDACEIMSKLVDDIELPENSEVEKILKSTRPNGVSDGRHLELYRKFIKYYPQMQSEKLYKIADYNIVRKNTI